MTPNLDSLKRQFREGRRTQAIAEAEVLCAAQPFNLEAKRLCATMHVLTRNFARSLELLLQVRDPAREDADILFNIGMCERELKNFPSADRYFEIFTGKFPASADGWASRAECKFQLGEFAESIRLADRAIEIDGSMLAAWTVRGHSQKGLGQWTDALGSYRNANAIQPTGEASFHVGLVLAELGKPHEAVESFMRAMEFAPSEPDTLKKATLCLLERGQGEEALALCREVLRAHPGDLTARLGAQWILTQLVPLWHVPMMNEPERNQAFQDGLARHVTPDRIVFEIGTGSGLLAMMAARLGAKQVVTCEAVGLIANTARKIVARNGYEGRITVLAKPSNEVRLGPDLPVKADILVHEIFSSELLGEHVLPAIEDAKARLLKPGGAVLPASASIMIALVGGDALGKNLHVAESFGFDLGEFNAIHPRKRPLYREDLAPVLMSGDVEAFRFDFQRQSSFPVERKTLQTVATQPGFCWGVIQWIRIEMAEGVHFENHPSRPRAVSNWQHTVYGFHEPLQLQVGAVVTIDAMHDRARPWFDLRS
jgi:tetratricopeptide (TPR) repeat protein